MPGRMRGRTGPHRQALREATATRQGPDLNPDLHAEVERLREQARKWQQQCDAQKAELDRLKRNSDNGKGKNYWGGGKGNKGGKHDDAPFNRRKRGR